MINDRNEQVEEYEEWLSFAKMDFDVAVHLNSSFYPKPISIICYHCQQAAEKAVKGLVVYFGRQGGMPKVHDITFLLNQIKNIVYEEKGVVVSHELLKMADYLSKYGVMSRYPNEIEVDEVQTIKALKSSEEILGWVQYVVDTNKDK